MAKSKHKRTPKTVLKLPDLEQSKSAVMNSLTSASSSAPTIIRFANSSTGTAQSLDLGAPVVQTSGPTSSAC
jgi:hypothetical protein